MSFDPVDGSPRLGDWITSLVANLAGESAALARLQEVLGDRRTRITLDDETVVVAIVNGRVIQLHDEAVNASVTTGRATVLALLDGRLDATDALRSGLVTVEGGVDDLTAMLHGVEILLDAATRIPGLRSLASAYRKAGGRSDPSLSVPPESVDHQEISMLRRLGLTEQDS